MKDFEVKFREKEEGSNYDGLVEDEIVISPIYKMVKEETVSSFV